MSVQAIREQVLWFAQSFTAPECACGIVSFLYLTEVPVRRWKVGEIRELLDSLQERAKLTPPCDATSARYVQQLLG